LLHANLTALGYDPQIIDAVVLSHIHQDHTGGLWNLLDSGANPAVYLPATFPADFKHRIETQGSVTEIEKSGELMPGFFTTGPIGTQIAEQALAIQTPSGLVVLTGCAHPGVLPLVQQALKVTGSKEVTLLIGGFHLSGSSSAKVEGIIGDLQKLGVHRVAPCHCTGAQAQQQFSEAYGVNYLHVGAGWSLSFSE
jgi:7,8-dihydropterin-6-yl-methyl-4-(beta-D-ribofuranosyl)aminobenzene 5'-phosphate synthase